MGLPPNGALTFWIQHNKSVITLVFVVVVVVVFGPFCLFIYL